MGNTIIFLSALGLLVLAVLVIGIYFFYYRSKIDQRLTNPEHMGKIRLWSPLRVCLTTVIGALAMFAAICVILAVSNPAMPPADIPDTYYTRIFSPEEMQAGYVSQYSIEENTGYTKAEKVVDDVEYTTFISTEGADTIHPLFLIYAKYVGESTTKYNDVYVSFQTFQGQEMANAMSSGSEGKDNIVCIMGNAFADCTISCIVDFYDEKREEFNLEKLQEENTPLIISIPAK